MVCGTVSQPFGNNAGGLIERPQGFTDRGVAGACGSRQAAKEVALNMVKVDPDECVGCETCVDVCPVEAISMVDDKAVIDQDTCTECETCIPECPVEAINVE